MTPRGSEAHRLEELVGLVRVRCTDRAGMNIGCPRPGLRDPGRCGESRPGGHRVPGRRGRGAETPLRTRARLTPQQPVPGSAPRHMTPRGSEAHRLEELVGLVRVRCTDRAGMNFGRPRPGLRGPGRCRESRPRGHRVPGRRDRGAETPLTPQQPVPGSAPRHMTPRGSEAHRLEELVGLVRVRCTDRAGMNIGCPRPGLRGPGRCRESRPRGHRVPGRRDRGAETPLSPRARPHGLLVLSSAAGAADGAPTSGLVSRWFVAPPVTDHSSRRTCHRGGLPNGHPGREEARERNGEMRRPWAGAEDTQIE
ncbi:hypothetical protein NDU88_007366 [Pleurodeles waltl]|uniref:Uncharacterized protein n=1 Tax=Pleurodeles waltl TaxID=8319 RepID=A0AAV7WGR7_PLEWA|nr:hypothetical protein NDU88_007366 [Pleurodeles waltl]